MDSNLLYLENHIVCHGLVNGIGQLSKEGRPGRGLNALISVERMQFNRIIKKKLDHSRSANAIPLKHENGCSKNKLNFWNTKEKFMLKTRSFLLLIPLGYSNKIKGY